MLRVTVALVVLALATQSLKAGDRAFIPGHVFVSEIGTEGCFQQRCWIREIDPDTGDSWIFADYSDGLCDNSGLRFTPDGSRLRVLNLSNNTIQDFDADGNGTIVYSSADGLGGPFGGNGLLWNARGDFFVANEYSLQVLRFPFDGAPPQVVVDDQYGMRTGGGLALHVGPDLFLATYELLRIAPDGGVTTFDDYSSRVESQSATFDRYGNLYVAAKDFREETLGGVIRRYHGTDPATREVLAGQLPASDRVAIALSVDESMLYYASNRNLLAIDWVDGAARVIFTTPQETKFVRRLGKGIAIYTPPKLGDLNCDDRVNNFDIDPFVLALTDAAGYQARYGWCDRNRADVNGDGGIDNFDIDAFVEAVVAGSAE